MGTRSKLHALANARLPDTEVKMLTAHALHGSRQVRRAASAKLLRHVRAVKKYGHLKPTIIPVTGWEGVSV